MTKVMNRVLWRTFGGHYWSRQVNLEVLLREKNHESQWKKLKLITLVSEFISFTPWSAGEVQDDLEFLNKCPRGQLRKWQSQWAIFSRTCKGTFYETQKKLTKNNKTFLSVNLS